jgi:NAD(P)H-hydrate epimerase
MFHSLLRPRTLNRAQSREVDRLAIEQYGIPGLVLMENAGRGVADAMAHFGIRGPVVICCGKGNNAGDGLVIARHLDLRGCQVRLCLFARPEDLTGDAAVNSRIVEKIGLPATLFAAPLDRDRLAAELGAADWIVDALLGTGAQGEPRPPIDAAIDAINAAGRKVMAVDLPSGLDGDTGQAARHTVRAAHTCALAALKPGLTAPAAAPYVGQVHVLDIGAPARLIDEILAPPR